MFLYNLEMVDLLEKTWCSRLQRASTPAPILVYQGLELRFCVNTDAELRESRFKTSSLPKPSRLRPAGTNAHLPIPSYQLPQPIFLFSLGGAGWLRTAPEAVSQDAGMENSKVSLYRSFLVGRRLT